MVILYLYCSDRLQEILAGHKPRQARERKKRDMERETERKRGRIK